MTEVTEKLVQAAWKDRTWQETGAPGLTLSVLRPTDGGASIFLKFEKGAVGAEHIHPEGEELLVVSGDITVGGRRLGPGDYLYTPPGGVHEAVAHEATVLFLSLPKAPIFL
jgi:quercetin dioxygenase-like cupin family protein